MSNNANASNSNISNATDNFVFDKHCALVTSNAVNSLENASVTFVQHEFSHEIEDSYIAELNDNNSCRSVETSLYDATIMDWNPANPEDDPHNAIQSLMSLMDYMPTNSVVEEVKKKNSKSSKGKSSKGKVNSSDIPEAKRLIRGEYRIYTEKQVNELLHLVLVEGHTAADAAKQAGIKVRTGQNYVRTAKSLIDQDLKAALEENDSDKEDIVVDEPVKERKYGKQKLFKVHSEFFIAYFEKIPDATLKMAREAVMEAFPGLEITVSAIQKHLVKKCALIMKKLEKLPERRNDEVTLEKRKTKILEWREIPGFDYFTNCIFIDEAGFNLHIKRTFGRAPVGKPAKIKVPTQRGVSITILGAMCEKGIVNLSLRNPSAVVSKKKRKLTYYTTADVNGRIGTRTNHYLAFLTKTMDVLDAAGLQGRYLIMDNAPIHTSQDVQNLITSRGYHCIYLPPYSPFLNPIEEMWSKIKLGVRREEVTTKDTLIPRITEASKAVTITDCVGWIRHSVSFFDRCINKEENL